MDDAFVSGSVHNGEIQAPEILVDICRIDPSVASSYTSHSLSGRTIPIIYPNHFTMQTSLSSTSAVTIPISRGFSRLNAVYINFLAAPPAANSGSITASHPIADFYSPLGAREGTMDVGTFQASYQLGSVKGPLYNTRSVGECFYHLRKTLRMADGTEFMGLPIVSLHLTSFMSVSILKRLWAQAPCIPESTRSLDSCSICSCR